MADIATILKSSSSDYKVIISPGYDQLKLNKCDYDVLCSAFGVDKVYDFSGKNDITEDFHNYYDISHYRPHIAAFILDSVYIGDRFSY